MDQVGKEELAKYLSLDNTNSEDCVITLKIPISLGDLTETSSIRDIFESKIVSLV